MNAHTTPAKAWKDHAFVLAWPTVLLMVGILIGEAVLWWVALAGHMSPWIAWAPATVLGYLAFTVMHEAGHGNIHGRHAMYKPLSEACGWLSGFVLAAPFPAFRVLHNLHHSHTNNPEKDPDHWVVGPNAFSVALRCLTIYFYYYQDFIIGVSSKTRPAKKERNKVLVTTAVFAAIAVGLSAAGMGVWVISLWIVPAILSCGLLAFVFDWIPHHPHSVQKRMHDTRVLLFPGLNLVTLGQSYHLIHHLWPRVPFYRYQACFRDSRPFLEANGAPIEGVETGQDLLGFGDSPVMHM